MCSQQTQCASRKPLAWQSLKDLGMCFSLFLCQGEWKNYANWVAVNNTNRKCLVLCRRNIRYWRKIFYQTILRALKLNIKVLNIIGVLNCHLILYWISLKYVCKLQKPVYNLFGKVLPKGKRNLKKDSKVNFFSSHCLLNLLIPLTFCPFWQK